MYEYRKVMNNNMCYKLKKNWVQNVKVYKHRIPLHNQSEKACMCSKTRQASTGDYTVFI